jgi:hypothetical protein
MPVLEQSESSNCANPVLDVFLRIGGVLTDPTLLEYQIFELVTVPGVPTQVYPPAGRATADLSDCPVGHRLSLGRFVGEWDVPAAEPVGDHLIRWFFKESAGAVEKSWDQEFGVVLPMAASSPVGYCTLAEMRAEGLTDPPYSDAWIESKITLASRYIDKQTRRFFEPRDLTLRVDGEGGTALRLRHPIISISAVNLILELGTGYDTQEVDLDDLVIYNRHLTQGLIDPDDRVTPRLETYRIDSPWGARVERQIGTSRIAGAFRYFEAGRQNVEVVGRFGYTELASGQAPGETVPGSQVPTSDGVTPPLIVECCKRLVIRELEQLGDPDAREDSRGRASLTEEKTRDQSYKRSGLDKLLRIGAWTGDPDIDELLASYVSGTGRAKAV